MIRSLLRYLAGTRAANARFLFAAPLAYPPGHFYSPICNPHELRRRYRDPRESTLETHLPGIDLAPQAQLELWQSWAAFLPGARALLTDTTSRRYRLPSSSYDVGDAIVYICMLCHLQPARLIEVGSGSSSAVALDAFDAFFPARPQCSFIEPYPSYLKSLLKNDDIHSIEIIETGVQDVETNYFEKLQNSDILFIDSTHIVKTGSDVLYEIFEILPRLRPGVVVHFHDVFYPFEYPHEWVIERNYSWNELYILRAFLTNNQDWEIMFFNDYFARLERAQVERDAPEMLANPGGGLWLRRRAGGQ